MGSKDVAVTLEEKLASLEEKIVSLKEELVSCKEESERIGLRKKLAKLNGQKHILEEKVEDEECANDEAAACGGGCSMDPYVLQRRTAPNLKTTWSPETRTTLECRVCLPSMHWKLRLDFLAEIGLFCVPDLLPISIAHELTRPMAGKSSPIN